jgi:hypothetical protein
MKNAVFWDVVSCRSCVNRRFGGTYRLEVNVGSHPRRRYSSINFRLSKRKKQEKFTILVAPGGHIARLRCSASPDHWLMQSATLLCSVFLVFHRTPVTTRHCCGVTPVMWVAVLWLSSARIRMAGTPSTSCATTGPQETGWALPYTRWEQQVRSASNKTRSTVLYAPNIQPSQQIPETPSHCIQIMDKGV